MKKTLMIHTCWAVAVLAAFGLGSRSSAPASAAGAGDSSAPGQSRLAARASEREGGSFSSRRSDRGDRATAKTDRGALEKLFGPVGASDGNLDALIDQVLRDPNPITRRLAFSKLLESMTPENAALLRQQLATLGTDSTEWRDFHYAWGALDGRAAFEHAANSPERDLAITMSGWAAANPAEAMAMLDNLPEEMKGQRDELTASLVAGLADNNRGMATDYVLRLGQEGNARAGSLMDIVAGEAIRAEGPEGAARWSESLPDGPLKSTAMGRVADAYARQDPEAAARWAQNLAGKTYADRAIEQIGGRWAQSNPVAAVDWLQSLPAGNGQTAGLRNAFGDWEDRDPAAAGQYLASMPQSPQRDSAISGFATGYAWQNPQVAIAWAQDIRDPALRESSLTRAGQAFYRRDPQGALAWLENSGLPDAARQQILQPDRR